MDKMSKILTLASLICLYNATARATEDLEICPHKVIFLPQSHAPDNDFYSNQPNTEIILQVSESQLKIADYIERFPGVPVFSENVGRHDLAWKSLSLQEKNELRNYFSPFQRGLPSSSSMTDEQREKLFGGGELVQMTRGKLTMIHRVLENEVIGNQIFAPIEEWFKTNPPTNVEYPPEVGQFVYGEREKQALLQINKYFLENPNQRNVILIYGSKHNFNFYPEIFKPSCISIPPEFQQDWRGRFREGPNGFSTGSTAKDDDATKSSKPMDASR